MHHLDTPAFVAIDFETADYGRDSACALLQSKIRIDVRRLVIHGSKTIR